MRTRVERLGTQVERGGGTGSSAAWRRGPAAGLLAWTLAFPAAPTTLEAQSASSDRPTSEIEVLEWMSGCWELRSPDRVTVERWGDARSDVLLGTSQTTAGGRTMAWEFLRIASSGTGSMTFYAHPSGQSPAEFEATLLTADSVVFANPRHDFPQLITYRRRPDSLLASIGGQDPSGLREVFFPYVRIPCDGSGGGV